MFEKLKGYKVQVVGMNIADRPCGLLAEVNEEFIKLVPFVEEPVQQEVYMIDPSISINSVKFTIYKRISKIDTILVLGKPDEMYEN